MQFDKTIVPKEIHQKETIAIHIPVINRPVTYRHIAFFIPGFIVSLLIQLGWATFFELPVNIEDKIFDIGMRIIIFIMVPMFFVMFSGHKREDKYLEEIFFRKISYAKKSAIVLNEKSLRAIKKYSDK